MPAAPEPAAPAPRERRFRPRRSGFRWEQAWEQPQEEDRTGKLIDIKVPPEYTGADFPKHSHRSNRGKLDVPKERFIPYPGAPRSRRFGPARPGRLEPPRPGRRPRRADPRPRGDRLPAREGPPGSCHCSPACARYCPGCTSGTASTTRNGGRPRRGVPGRPRRRPRGARAVRGGPRELAARGEDARSHRRRALAPRRAARVRAGRRLPHRPRSRTARPPAGWPPSGNARASTSRRRCSGRPGTRPCAAAASAHRRPRTRERLLRQVPAAADTAGETGWGVPRTPPSCMPVVRAHRHAAGARNGPPPAPASERAGRGAQHRRTGGRRKGHRARHPCEQPGYNLRGPSRVRDVAMR